MDACKAVSPTPPLAIRIGDLGGSIFEANEAARRIKNKLFGPEPQNVPCEKESAKQDNAEWYVTRHEAALSDLRRLLNEIADRLGA